MTLLTGLDPSIRVAITSNLSHPLVEFVQHVSPERVINVTASFHPMENGTRTHPMNPEIFVGRCLFLQNYGFNVTVNAVAWPEQIYLIPAWAEMLHSHGLRFHVDPYSSIAYHPYEYSDTERKFLEPWIWEDRRADSKSQAGRADRNPVFRRRRSPQRAARWLCVALHPGTAVAQPAGQRV